MKDFIMPEKDYMNLYNDIKYVYKSLESQEYNNAKGMLEHIMWNFDNNVEKINKMKNNSVIQEK